MSRPIPALAFALCTALAGCAGGPWGAGQLPRNDEVFNRIQFGMTTDEVRRLVGAPDETMRFPLSGHTAWDYQYQDGWGYLVVFSVTFGADGRAVGKIGRRVNDGGDHR